jgi:hypothetical protein
MAIIDTIFSNTFRSYNTEDLGFKKPPPDKKIVLDPMPNRYSAVLWIQAS